MLRIKGERIKEQRTRHGTCSQRVIFLFRRNNTGKIQKRVTHHDYSLTLLWTQQSSSSSSLDAHSTPAVSYCSADTLARGNWSKITSLPFLEVDLLSAGVIESNKATCSLSRLDHLVALESSWRARRSTKGLIRSSLGTTHCHCH